MFNTIDAPPLRPDEVRIQPTLCGICGTDISVYQGHRDVTFPFIPGHEVLGRVCEVGEKVTKLKVGARVIVEPNYPCGQCALCRRGRGAVCAQKGAMGVNIPGCFAEYVVAPAEFVWPTPDAIADRDAVTIEPLTVSLHGLWRCAAKPGDTIAVLGCGVVGLLLVHAAVAMGLRVIAHDRFAGKLAMASSLGAITCLPEADTGHIAALWADHNVTTVFECAGVAATTELALAAAPRATDVVLLGISAQAASFVPQRVVREGVNILTSMIYDHPADFARAIALVAAGRLTPSRVITNEYALKDINQALECAATGAAGKILLVMNTGAD